MINSQVLWLREVVHSTHVPSHLSSYASHNSLGATRTYYNFPLQSGRMTPSSVHLHAHHYFLLPEVLSTLSTSLCSSCRMADRKHNLEEVKSIQKINIFKILSS